MSWGGVNFIAVIVAALAAMVIGAVWYRLFAGPWMAAQAWPRESAAGGGSHSGAAYITAVIGKLVMAFCLARLLALVDAVSASNGVALGLFLWIGFVATALSVNDRFALRPWRLTAIDAGYWLAVLLAIGAIVGAFGPAA